MKNNFKDLLQQKLFRKPDSNFDQRFWKKFNNEFNTSKPGFVLWFQRNIWLVSSSTAAATITIFVMFNSPHLFAPKKEIETAHEILQTQEMFDSMDLLLDFEDDWGFRDDTWEDLLNPPEES